MDVAHKLSRVPARYCFSFTKGGWEHSILARFIMSLHERRLLLEVH